MNRPRSQYEVGYGKPPRYTRFRKGHSGNPKGRPKGAQNWARLACQIFNEKIVIRENGERRTITKFEAALKQLMNKAASGDAAAIREVIRLRAAIADIEAAENQSRPAAEPSDRPIQDDVDRSRVALAILNLLHASKDCEPE